MTLSQLAENLAITIDADTLGAYYPVPENRRGELCSTALIARLQERFSLFGDYYDDVLVGFADLQNDPMRYQYLDIVSLCIKDRPLDEVRAIPYPPYVGTPASAMLPLLAHLPSVEGLYDEWRQRGFTHE